MAAGSPGRSDGPAASEGPGDRRGSPITARARRTLGAMSSIRNPVGPQPPTVYWRRRLLVLLGALAVVLVIVLIIVRPGAGEEGAPTPAPTGSATPTTAATVASGDEEPCSPDVVALTPVTDAAGYSSGQQPLVSMTIVNTGSVPCSFDVGTAAQEYIITSGSDRIWSSADCQTGGTSTEIVLEPGVEQSTTPFPWDRTRSSTDTCDQERPQVTAGGASYHLQVRVGEAESASTKQFLLD